jgi:tyrosyl-tRNA synthetase
MSFAEFSYQIFQAYDFYHLHKEHGCLIQVGFLG